MKQIFRQVALLSLLGLTAVSCQKETLIEPQGLSETVATYTVYYTIDGETSQITLVGETAWRNFLDWIFAKAEEGHRVSFYLGGHEMGQAKETITYTTTNYDDAVDWANKMSHNGYSVTIEFDEQHKQYVCTASNGGK